MTDEHAERDVSAADEQALADLFASLTSDAPASEASPAEIIKLGRIEQQHVQGARIKRFKVARNVLVAAVLAALVVMIVPHLGAGSSESTAASSSVAGVRGAAGAAASGAAALPSAGPAPMQSAGSAPMQSAAAAPGNAASTSAAEASGAAPAGRASAAAPHAPMRVTPPMSAAPFGPAASSALSAGATVPGPAGTSKGVDSMSPEAASSAAASSTGCPPLPVEALAAFRSAFPPGYFGPVEPATHAGPCAALESRLPVVKQTVMVTVEVRRAAVGACLVTCELAGDAGVYVSDTSGRRYTLVGPIYVYANGYEVSVRTEGTGPNPTTPSFDQLVAGARAVIKTLG